MTESFSALHIEGRDKITYRNPVHFLKSCHQGLPFTVALGGLSCKRERIFKLV